MTTELDKAMETLKRLPLGNQKIVVGMIESLGKAAGVDTTGEYAAPSDSIGAWLGRMAVEGKAKTTIAFYRQYAERFLKAHPRPTRLDVQAYLAKRLEEGVTETAVKNMQKSLRSLFGFLAEEGLWPEDVTAGLKSIKVPKTERYVPPVADIEKVLAGGWTRAADADKFRLLIVLLMETGLRATEAITVEKTKVDLEARSLVVLGKGAKVRKVPLTEPIVAYLVRHLEDYPSESPFLFPGKGKSGHFGIHNLDKDFKHACVRAGVKPFVPHSLRHYFATTMLRNGARLEIVSRILGHSSVGITADIYTHIEQSELRDAVDKHGPLSEK